LTEHITIPKGLLKELHEGLVKVEEVLATLEELTNREGLNRIKRAEEEYKKGEYITIKNAEEIGNKF